MTKNPRTVYAATVLLSLLVTALGWYCFRGFRVESPGALTYYRAKVQSVDTYSENVDFNRNIIKTVNFTASIREGPDKGQTLPAVQEIGGAYAAQEKQIGPGDAIFISYGENGLTGEIMPHFTAYNRSLPLSLLAAGFFALIVVIGGKKGLSTILSLVFTCMIIFLVYIPSILSGANVYLSTGLTGVYIVLMSLLLINGPGKKTLCAVLGNIGGVVVAAALAIIMQQAMKMTGFISDETMMLSMAEGGAEMNLLGIVWGGIVLGSLGAIMDVAMTIASAMQELSEHMTQKSFGKMLASGMNIGRDAIGTMTNTLILAYIGSSLALVLLLIMNSTNIGYLFSTEMIASEVLQALAGSVGILFAVPFTAFFSAYIYTKR